jgi:hypothetical protein
MQIPNFKSFTTTLLALAAAGGMALAGNSLTEDVKSGSASLVLDSQIAGLLALAQIQFIKVAPGAVSPAKGKITVPITGGALDTATGGGEIASGGGFKFAAQGLELSAIDYVVTIKNGTGTVSALITANNTLLGRTELASFTVNIPTPVVVPKNKKIKIEDISLTLSAAAATALNNAFSTGVFASGQNLGSYNITIVLAPKPL